jgi:hypothetical protein
MKRWAFVAAIIGCALAYGWGIYFAGRSYEGTAPPVGWVPPPKWIIALFSATDPASYITNGFFLQPALNGLVYALAWLLVATLFFRPRRVPNASAHRL